MNILINCPSLKKIDNKLGGIESLNLALAKKLTKKKFNVTISTNCKKSSITDKIKNLNINVLIKDPNKFNFDTIISSNDASIFNFYPNNLNKILWLHNKLQIEKAIRKRQFSSIIKNKITAVFVSNYLNNITSKLYFFKKRIIINNFLLPDFNKKKINLKRKLIFLWTVQRKKGLDETITMWIKDIFPKNNIAKFYILGIDKLDKKYDLKYLNSNNIFFKGRLDKKELMKIYQQSTAMICLGYDETFCLNALEANSCGLPVLTFGKTALKNFVKNGQNGFIVDDFKDLSKNILNLLKQKNIKRIKLIKNCLLYSKKYRLDNIINYWLKLLK